jgi:hypothetical protein
MTTSHWSPWQGTGDPSRRWLVLAWSVLAVYRALRPFTGEKRALSLIGSVLSRQFRKRSHAYMSDRFGIDPARPQDAFECISRNYKARGESLFGPRFTYVQVLQDHRQSHTHITRCLFNEFFKAHRAAEVVSLFCALDSIWIDELHQARYGVRFERPTTLARGDDACRFLFSRATPNGSLTP